MYGKLRTRFWATFGVGLMAGSVSSLAIKAAYQTLALGADGETRFFDKPWLMSLVMFAAMSVAFPLYLVSERIKGKTGGENESLNWQTAVWLGIPSVFDLLGSSIQQMGLVLIPVSSFQMLKGSIVVFSAVLSVVALNRRMQFHQYVGIGMCVVALSLVGLASVLGRADQIQVTSLSQTIYGILFVVIGQILCASQYILEEFLLRPPHDVPPLALVGVEGMWGLVLMGCVVLPILNFAPGADVFNVVENTTDSLVKIANSGSLQVSLGVYFWTCLVFNICGVMVTHQASAVHHTFLDATRTGFIWLGSLFLFYCTVTEHDLGEPLTTYSWLQALGFLVLVLGQLVYNRAVPSETADLPKFSHELTRSLLVD